MSTSLLRVVERAQQDAEQGPEAIQSNGLRRVSAPPTPTGRGPARSAHETLGRTLQLLRSERQPSKSGPSGSRHATGLAKMAAPSQPAHASHVGAVQPIVGTLPASPAAGCRADMGGVATRHISGGAGWWKSPCPVLVRASGEQSPGATRPPVSLHGGCVWRLGDSTKACQGLRRSSYAATEDFDRTNPRADGVPPGRAIRRLSGPRAHRRDGAGGVREVPGGIGEAGMRRARTGGISPPVAGITAPCEE